MNNREIFFALSSSRAWIALLMGFASGLPLLLTLTVLQAWLTQSDISLVTVGMIGLVGLPYNFKFLWAPLLDRFYVVTVGRRKSWLLISQIFLSLSIVFMGTQDPLESLNLIVASAILITFFSATQDIVIDAYRRESLKDQEQGIGAMMYTYGYRLGMLLASGGGLILADLYSFNLVYFFMAGVMLLTIAVSFIVPEPDDYGSPSNLKDAFVMPVGDFVERYHGVYPALLVLFFIVIYKLGDNFASHMSIPFYLDSGYSNAEIGAVVKVFGLAPLLFGIFIGGIINLRYGLFYSLVLAGVLQGLSTFGFILIDLFDKNLSILAVVISFENLSGGMGTACLLAFMALITNKQFTATQFALLSALAALPRVILTAPTGWLVELMDWTPFFVMSGLIAIPGVLLIFYKRDWINER
ncbi:MAG: AmpG family muropeptide MFS transporter [Gammaproteobacteria bacterium]